jgi:hypothetical protein
MIARAVTLGAVWGLLGCTAGSRPDQGAAAPMSDTLTVTGVVRVTGSDPLAQLVVQPEGGEPTALVGPLQSELHQTVGVEVRITGIPADPAPPSRSALEVLFYETVALNGMPAHTGVIERSGDEFRLVTRGRRWTLLNPPDQLRQSVGAKVWVAGDSSGEALRVSAYGIIKRGS